MVTEDVCAAHAACSLRMCAQQTQCVCAPSVRMCAQAVTREVWCPWNEPEVREVRIPGVCLQLCENLTSEHTDIMDVIPNVGLTGMIGTFLERA
jgi:hypothetical protein